MTFPEPIVFLTQASSRKWVISAGDVRNQIFNAAGGDRQQTKAAERTARPSDMQDIQVRAGTGFCRVPFGRVCCLPAVVVAKLRQYCSGTRPMAATVRKITDDVDRKSVV